MVVAKLERKERKKTKQRKVKNKKQSHMAKIERKE